MLSFNLTRLFAARGVARPFTYMVSRGFSSSFATSVINNRKHQFNLREVERLCELLKCTPNDLLEWVPSAEQAAVANHPLKPLERTEKVAGLTQLLSAVPLDKLAHIETIIKKELGE